MAYIEKDLEFEFPRALKVTKLDEQGTPEPHGAKRVDFLIYYEDRIVFFEVKSPNSPLALQHGERERFISELQDPSLFVEKARDSYTIVDLMEWNRSEERTIPVDYVVLIDAPDLTSVALSAISTKIARRLAQEMSEPWRKRYVRHAMVINDFRGGADAFFTGRRVP